MGGQQLIARREQLWFWGIAILAIFARIASFNAYAAHAPDEIIQYLEQAHRIVFGYGVVPWEFREFIRSWLIPLMLVPPMQLGEWLNPGGELYLVLPRAMIASLNFAPVIAAWFIGRRISLQHAIVGMAVAGLWVESVAFSVQTLSESLGVAAFMSAAALLHREARMPAIVIAGALLALTVLFRFQFGPAAALFGVMMAGKDRRVWKGLIAGGLPIIATGGLIDAAMGLTPFEWIANNYQLNIAEGKMRAIAGSPQPLRYMLYLIESWQWALPFIALLLLAGWRRHKALMAAALINLILHQLIGHKEYRYIWLSIQLFLLLAAFGSVDAARQLLRRDPDSRWVAAGLAGAWALVSVALSQSPVHRDAFRTDNDPARAAAIAMQSPTTCGLAVPRRRYWQFGYSLLHADKPLFLLADKGPVSRSRVDAVGSGFNALISYATDLPPDAPWFRQRCSGQDLPLERTCLYVRLGPCRVDERNRHYLIQQAMIDADM